MYFLVKDSNFSDLEYKKPVTTTRLLVCDRKVTSLLRQIKPVTEDCFATSNVVAAHESATPNGTSRRLVNGARFNS